MAASPCRARRFLLQVPVRKGNNARQNGLNERGLERNGSIGGSPDFFLDSRYERRQLEQVSKALGELPGASKLQFFTTRKASLMEQTPLDALARGQFSRVRTAAQGFAER